MIRVSALLAASLVALSGTPATADTPRGTYQLIPPEFAGDAAEQAPEGEEIGVLAAGARYTIFMNKNGGTYTPGVNNASTNRSSIPQQTSTVPAWNVSDAGWNQIMTCVRAQFSRFDVDITDVDPGSAPHFESVVAGSPQDIGMPSGVGGVSPFTNDCSTIENSIVFTFAEVFGNNYQVICEVVAQEVAHSYGLDHQFLCADPMTYLSGCGAKSFQDVNAQCGENQARTCACGQSTQNSVQMLAQRIGVADAIAPTVSITSPSDNATVGPGFSVQVAASDDQGLTRVELWVGGALAQTLTTAPYTFVTDATLNEGAYVVETRAYDSKNMATSSIQVTIDSNVDPDDPIDPDPTDPDPTDPDPDGNGETPSDLVGGCAAGGGAGSGLVLLIGLTLAFAWRRRHA